MGEVYRARDSKLDRDVAIKVLFAGETVSETLASVIKDDPDWSSLPGELPAHLRHLLERCLTKDPRLRLRDIGEARIALSGVLFTSGPRELEAIPAASLWQRALPWGVAGMAVLALAVGLISGRGKGNGRPAPVSRLTIDPSVQTWELDISPDGRQAAFTTGEGLMLRALDDFAERLVEETSQWRGSSFGPVYSPDGATIAFAVRRSLKRVSAAGDVVLDVAELSSAPLGLAWDGNDLLVGLGPEGIVRVAMDSGGVTPVVTLGPGEHAAMPRMLPGGDAVLFTMTEGKPNADWERSRIVVQQLPTGPLEVVVPSGSDARYLPTGHLVYAVGDVWFGVGFDLATRRTVGTPVVLIDGVQRGGSRGLMMPQATVSVSDTGTLVYLPGFRSSSERQIVVTTRDGSERVLDLPPNDYESPRLSPDGGQLAVSVGSSQESAIWIYDLSGELALRRLTFTGSNRLPVWSPDGERLAFQSTEGGRVSIVVRRVDGAGETERLTTAEEGTLHIPESWSSDGRHLSFSTLGEDGASLWLYSMRDGEATAFGGARSVAPLNSTFSPDGRWLSYTVRSPISSGGGTEVLVQPVPATGAIYQISRAGEPAHHSFWSRDGREIFYFGMDGTRLLSAPISVQAGVAAGNPELVPALLPAVTRETGPLNTDVTPDGRAFVWTKPLDLRTTPQQTAGVHVVLNWFQELEEKVPSVQP